MTTTARDREPLASDVLSALEPTDAMDAADGSRRGGRRRWLLPGLVLLIIVGLGAVGFARLAGTFGSSESGRLLTHTVETGELLITITEEGNLESAANKDIKCEVAGGSTILWIVDDGKLVKQGEELARLDSSQLEDQINQQKITYEKARATYIQAEKDYSVAKISVDEYLEGTHRKELQDLEAQITIALENLRSAENSLRHTQRMFRKGYVTPLQREAQEFAVRRAELELESARTAKDVLEKFTKEKTLEDLRSKRDTAEARKNSEKAAFELEEARLKRFQAQLEKCVILAPQDGMAVYANQGDRHRFGPQEPEIEEGAAVREQQTIFRLPDLTKMQVKVGVHESKVDQLRRGMRARIRIQDQDYRGTVDSIANQPQAAGRFMANVKEYATTVKIDGQQSGIKPGMTAEVEILVAHLKDVPRLPVAAIVEQRGGFCCWVTTDEGLQRRPLVLGLSNDSFVEVKDGVAAGEEVVLNPRTVIAEAREETYQQEEVNVEKEFGASSGAQQEPGRGGGPFRPEGGPTERPSRGPRAPGAEEPRGPGRPTPGSPQPDGGRRSGPGGRRGMMDLDRDGDGKISREEAPEPMRGFFDKLDANGDGFIDAAEWSTLQRRSGRGGGRSGGGPGAGPGGGPGSGPGGGSSRGRPGGGSP